MQQDYKNYDFKKIEREVKEYWDRNRIYRKTKEMKSTGENFYFNDGPPYTSGAIHMGTAYNKIIKDFVLRFFRMRGYNVRDQPGYDMHGLPIEVQVERSLGIKNKKEIESFGVKKFVERCRGFALEHERKMTDEFKALGVWMDWDNPYETIRNSYMSKAWWLIKKASDTGLLEKSLRLVNWCPRCETALADAEVEYRDREDDSIYVKMELKDGRFIIIWTTTPWTLPANMAIAYNPDFIYDELLVEKNGEKEKWILQNAEQVVNGSGYVIKEHLSRIEGSALEGLEYIHPLNILPEKTRRLLPAEYVTSENTGFVHIAPGHGAEDFDLGRKFGLDVFCPVDESGRFTEEAGKYAAKSIFDANREIIEDLAASNHLVKSEKITHRYGYCWRCKTPIIYRATAQWFLLVEDIKEKMIDEIKRVRWYPEWAGSARELEWVKGAKNWCISRQRYWGIPLPIWVCKECGKKRVIGSEEELRGLGYKEEELHRPWIDSFEFNCECGGAMQRIKDVQDVWLDSGVSSWAELTDEEMKLFPPKLIIEAHDQTRGWFYSQLGAGIIGYDRAPYDEVMMHGWIISEMGEKMSKSIGNVIAPLDMTEKYGIDSLRFYLLSSSAPWEDKSFMVEGVKNANRTMNILWNAQNFAISYMLLDNFNPESKDYELEKEDLWLMSRLENMKKRNSEYMKEYELHRICRDIEEFIIEDLSRFYIKVVRKRVWTEEKNRNKNGVYKTLYEALMELSKLLAPATPYIAERLYRNLGGPLESIHMESWPDVKEDRIDLKLERDMGIAKEIIEATLSARQNENIKVRQPLKRMVVETSDEIAVETVKELGEIIKEQTNANEIELSRENQAMPSCDFSRGKVYIDTEVTYEIRRETIARDLIRRIQEMRKMMDLNIEDYIKCMMELPQSFIKSFNEKKESIAKETRAKEITLEKPEGFVQEWTIDGERVVIGIVKEEKNGDVRDMR
jgi:isoleucyl-tRNA synthetase